MQALLLVGCGFLGRLLFDGTGKKTLTHHERAALLLDVANGALVEGDPTGALATLMQAEQEVRTWPKFTSRWHSLLRQGQRTEALKEAQTSVRMAPKYADANNTLGKILVDMGRYSEAVQPLWMPPKIRFIARPLRLGRISEF